jgi:hypothetical protein
MLTHWESAVLPVQYYLQADNVLIDLNKLIGKELAIQFSGKIFCISCQRATKKSFSQGYCYPCFIKLPACDMCQVRPETCHFDEGTCRDPEWGEKNCFISHTVYLACSPQLKVGITRTRQRMTRWIDQGASYALPLMQVTNRKKAGELEVELKKTHADKTAWQMMLKGLELNIDLEAAKATALLELKQKFEVDIEDVQDPFCFSYPVLEYPKKISSINLEKQTEFAGVLLGIRGQYLIFDSGVINIRKYSGYQIKLQTC